jgi:hypothetical protein
MHLAFRAIVKASVRPTLRYELYPGTECRQPNALTIYLQVDPGSCDLGPLVDMPFDVTHNREIACNISAAAKYMCGQLIAASVSCYCQCASGLYVHSYAHGKPY